MKTNIFWEYLPIMGLVYVGVLMLLSIVYLIARFMMPIFKDMKVGKVKLTLGFYFISYAFGFLGLPFLYPNMPERLFQAWQVGIAIVGNALGTVTGYYFGRNSAEDKTQQPTPQPIPQPIPQPTT